MSDDELSEIRRELQELRDRQAITDMYNRYAWLMDSREFDRVVVEVFEEGSSLSLGVGHEPVVGRAAQRSRLDRVEELLEGTAHYVTNIAVEFADTTHASARAYVQSYNWSREEGPARPIREVTFVGIGVYLDDLVKGEDGWRITRRRRRNLGPSPLGHGVFPAAMSAAVPSWGGSDAEGDPEHGADPAGT